MGFLELGKLRECVCVLGKKRREREREKRARGRVGVGRVGSSGFGSKKSYLGYGSDVGTSRPHPALNILCPFLKLTRDLKTPRSHPAPNTIQNSSRRATSRPRCGTPRQLRLELSKHEATPRPRENTPR